jgi:hypothetical protein
LANNTIKIRRTTTAGKVPSITDIAVGEFAFNLTDRKAFTSDGSVTFEIGANTSFNIIGANSTVNGVKNDFIQFTTTAATTQTVDSWPIASWRTGKYDISIKDNNANNHMSAAATLLYSGVATLSVYGVVYSNTYMGTFTATANATSAILQFTPVSTNTTVSMSRTLITI